ncbi:MAG: hypothetical protein CVV49_14580 [Spirochaetae bacterium HGW-Spirochaetae-5]|nr:MAG: hypothetical protein CVV49_14580 [Spirochaetae bacterium HGW-Spirochaetae-5]
MKKWLLLSVIMLFISSSVMAEVIMLHDGNIYLGKITNTDSKGIILETFGQTLTISQSDILKNDKNFDSFKDMTVDITLRDGSLIKGKIQNYDEEVGIFVSIDFGTITLPVESIEEISDPVKKKYYIGSPVSIGISGGYYIPVFGLAPDFESSYNFSLFAEFNSSFLRGLAFGGELQTIMIDYKADDSNFSIYLIQPYLIYKFLDFKKESSFINRFTPFISAGIGGAYIIKKSVVTEKSEINPAANMKIGSDITITESVRARIFTGFETILQSSTTFNRLFVNAGVMYSF